MKHFLAAPTRLLLFLVLVTPFAFCQSSAIYNVPPGGTPDVTTQGTWTNTYGGDGYQIANGPSNLPTYATVAPPASTYTWASPTTDSRALQMSSGSSSRIASAYLGSTVTINVNLNDGNSHIVALYLLDWDSNNQRAESITVQDATTGAPFSSAPTQTFTDFGGGVWASYTIKGNVNFVVTTTNTYLNAAVSGIFFGSAANSTPPPSASSSATYNGPPNGPLDVTTQGNWTNTYGGDGYQIADGGSQLPQYANVTLQAGTYTWEAQTADPRALQISAGASTNIASAYLANSSLVINVNLTDGASHIVALYLLDWDGNQRAETISVEDASTGTLLTATPQSFTSFNGGVWASYTITGNVKIVIESNNTYLNAAVSGIFFGPATSTKQPQSIQNFGAISAQVVGTPLTLTATASSGLPVSYSASPNSVCAVSGVTASFAAQGNCTITASQPGNSTYAAATSVSQNFTVNSGPGGGGGSGSTASATYNGMDTITQGNWTGIYGGDGYIIAAGNSMIPGYASVNIYGDSIYTWVPASTYSYPRGLQVSSGASTYLASTFFSGTSFTINVNINDNNSHNIALYLLDWDTNQRAETISVEDAATGALLAPSPIPPPTGQAFTNFTNGVWANYTIKGNVNIVVHCDNTYLNAVVSGIFFSAPASSPPSPGTYYTLSGNVSLGGANLPGVTLTATGSTSLQATSDSNGHYSFTVPANGNITVTPTLSGYIFNPLSFSWTATSNDSVDGNFSATSTAAPPQGAAPVITSLSLTQGPAQMGFQINGSNFGDSGTVAWGTGLKVLTWTNTQITVQVLAMTPNQTSNVTVTNPAGQTSNGMAFTVITPFVCSN